MKNIATLCSILPGAFWRAEAALKKRCTKKNTICRIDTILVNEYNDAYNYIRSQWKVAGKRQSAHRRSNTLRDSRGEKWTRMRL
ncbi:MAG: hypothetical protein ACI4D2_08030 [Lachnospiraceae bacterium]